MLPKFGRFWGGVFLVSALGSGIFAETNWKEIRSSRGGLVASGVGSGTPSSLWLFLLLCSPS